MNVYLLDITVDVDKKLEDLPAKHCAQIWRTIVKLRLDPRPQDSRPVTGYKPYLRVDTGEYRIIYLVSGNIVKIIVAGKRNDDEIYQEFKRKIKNIRFAA